MSHPKVSSPNARRVQDPSPAPQAAKLDGALKADGHRDQPPPIERASFQQGGSQRVEPSSGKPVAQTAEPSNLWGGGDVALAAEIAPDLENFSRLNQASQKAKLTELKRKQEALSRQVVARCEQLDSRYRAMRSVSRSEMLKQLSSRTASLSAAEKEHLDELLDRMDELSEKIESLRKEAKALPNSKDADEAQRRERAALAQVIATLRKERDGVSQVATEYVDSLGLKGERLAINERRIDRNAPESGAQSLSSMISEWQRMELTLEAMTAIWDALLKSLIPTPEELEAEKRRQRMSEDEQRLQRQFVDRSVDQQRQERQRMSSESQLRAEIRRISEKVVANTAKNRLSELLGLGPRSELPLTSD